VAAPIDLSNPELTVFLSLYGTGIRRHASAGELEVRAGDTIVPVTYAGAQSEFDGQDQVNVELPRSLAGKCSLELLLSVAGSVSNKVELLFR
jgi:uncharacterized protein (TIGR03437 family)